MDEIRLVPQRLTRAAFAPYGDVIEAAGTVGADMNDGAMSRSHGLAFVDAGGGRPVINITRCREATSLPCRVVMMERHSLGSQAFIPLDRSVFVVVVAATPDAPNAGDLRAFVTDGAQGVNYRRGVWHMPLIGLVPGQEFLIVDRAEAGDNCEQTVLDERTPVILDAP